MKPRKGGGRLLAAAVAVATLPAAILIQLNLTSAGARIGTAPAAAAPGEATPARTVTLLTGDRVTLRGGNATTVEPGPGRTGIQFLTRRTGDHLSVIPSDTLSLLRAGRLDDRLFDITTLLAYGYDQRPDLRLIITHTATAREITLSDITSGGGRLMRDLTAVNGLAVRAEKANATRLWESLTGPGTATLDEGIGKIWLDGLRRPSLDTSGPQIGAPAAHAAGFDGTGVQVAVLDSGIDASHPDLAGQVTAQENFTEGTEGDADLVGHGTHVASTVAGTGAGAGGQFTGVAPGARLLDGKVCAVDGCAESWVIAGMQWAAEQGATVVNLSLGAPDTAGVDPLEQAVQSLTARHGTLFVAAAGNTAPALPVNSPASADAALAVGAVDSADELADFSSRGPRVGDGAIKPDLTAPGVDITAARSTASNLPGAAYTDLSGTSMATPHAAGAAAILAQRHPDWSADQLKAGLMGTAVPHPELDVFAQGSGRLDVAAAVARTTVATPGSLSFGRQSWPHDDDQPVTRTVTYRNDDDAPVTLELTVSARGPGGQPVPAGLFRVHAPSVTVPAGGTAEAAVTVDTRLAGPDGMLVGELTATAGTVAVRTPLAVDREVPSSQLTVHHLGLDGQPSGEHLTVVAAWDGSRVQTLQDPDGDGTVAVRLPTGAYSVLSIVTSQRPDQSFGFAALAQPRLQLAGDQAVTLDARLGRPVTVSVPATDAASVFAEASMIAAAVGSSVEVGTLGGSFAAVTTGQVGPDQVTDGYAARFSATYAQAGAATDSPFAYQLSWYHRGRQPAGFTRQVSAAGLATVRADHAGQSDATAVRTEGRKTAWSALPDLPTGGFAAALPFRLPSVRTEFYNTDGGGRWGRALDEVVPGPVPQFLTSTVAPFTTYQAGQDTAEAWNRGVFGPTVAAPQSPHLWVTRLGDRLLVLSPLYGDGAGRAGFSAIATGEITVFRDGQQIARSGEPTGEFTVPAQPADYRVQIVSQRPQPAELSTRVEVTWTFRSGQVAGDTPVRLPVSTVRFSPPVDNGNTAPSGRTATIPVTWQAQPDSAAGSLRTLAVQVSHDDGRTWAPAPLLTGPTRAQVSHPAGPGFVSLRATATDTAGNTVTQTVIRAYRIG